FRRRGHAMGREPDGGIHELSERSQCRALDLARPCQSVFGALSVGTRMPRPRFACLREGTTTGPHAPPRGWLQDLLALRQSIHRLAPRIRGRLRSGRLGWMVGIIRPTAPHRAAADIECDFGRLYETVPPDPSRKPA